MHVYTKNEMEKLPSFYFYQHEIVGVTNFAAAFPRLLRESNGEIAMYQKTERGFGWYIHNTQFSKSEQRI